MLPQSVAVVFDNTSRPDTTGVHCVRALAKLTKAVHLLPSELSSVSCSDFDLFIRIDDGECQPWPEQLRPCACWLIDTHIDFDSRLVAAQSFDFQFVAQLNGTQRLQECGLSNAVWLPLACDPALHRRHHVPNQWDLGFVGNLMPGRRSDLIAMLKRRYPRSFFGQAFGDDLSKVYSAARLGFNCAVLDDVNMRVFEIMACGVALITNDLAMNGQAELFRDGRDYVTYSDNDELLDKVAFYLSHDVAREKIARQGQVVVYERHTYQHRMQTILDSISLPRRVITQISTPIEKETGVLAEQIDVGIKSFLRPKALLRLLTSITEHYPSLAVTVVDDGGIDTAGDIDSKRCMDVISGNSQFSLLTLPFGSGVSAGRNRFVDQTSRPFLLFLDDDFVFTLDTRLDRLLHRMHCDESVGIVAGVCMDATDYSRVPRRSGGTLEVDDDRLIHRTVEWLDPAEGTCHYFPTFALIRRELFEEGIRWRGGIGAEHYDFCLQVMQSRWKALIDSIVCIDHDHSIEALPGYLDHRLNYADAQQWLLKTWNLQSIEQDGITICKQKDTAATERLANLSGRPRMVQHFEDLSYYQFVRPDVLAMVPTSASKVLDIGCGGGGLGNAIKLRQSAHVTGVEINPVAAAAARDQLDEVSCIDIETSDWPFGRDQFDCVIVADVLEHLRAPEQLLRSIRESLQTGGVLVGSVPNVRYHAVVSALLEGNWTYEASGILDETHLRFFTRREIEKLLYRCGYEVLEWQVIAETSTKGREGHTAGGALTMEALSDADDKAPRTYQFLFVAAPISLPDAGLTSIIMLTHNQLSYTRMCLDSIRMRTDEPYELIIVDNCSTDGTQEYLRGLRGIKLIINQENRGFPAGVNQGLRQATGDQVLLLNNDTIVTTGWLRRMLNCLASDSTIGLVGPMSNRVSGIQCIDAGYDNIAKIDGFAWEWTKQHIREIIDTHRLVGFCLLARRSLIEKIGGLDERFGLGYFEDDDYCLRAIEAGYRCVAAVDAFVHHFSNQTFATMGDVSETTLNRNRDLFERKWGLRQRSADPVHQGRTTNVTSEASRRFRTERASNGTMLLKRAAPSISLCMIVRDNESTIGPALQSIKPWVDEMIVVDTGSTDHTVEIARSLGANVHHLPWPDSFAEARNESIKYAKGDWIFWMDSDDTISVDNGQKMRDVLQNPPLENVLGFIMQVHCPSDSSDGDSDATVVDHIKLFRNRSDLRFEGRIHEQIMPAIRRAGGDVAWTDIFVVHSGSDQTAEGQKRKQERDLRLLRMEEVERPDNSFVLFNIGMTYADMENHVEAVKALERAIGLGNSSESHLRKAYALLAGSLCRLGALDRAEQICQTGLQCYPNDTELLFRSGVIAHGSGQLEHAVGLYLRVLTTESTRHFDSIDQGLRGYKTHHNLALVYEDMQAYSMAEEQWRLVVSQMPRYRSGWHGLIRSLTAQKKFRQATEEAERMLQDDTLISDAHLLCADIASVQGDLTKSCHQLELALNQNPANNDARDRLCRYLFERSELSNLDRHLEEWVSIEPTNAAAWQNLGCNRLRMNQFASAEEALRSAIRLRPESDIGHLYLGFALEQLGKIAPARQAFETVLRVAPNSSTATEARERLARLGGPDVNQISVSAAFSQK